MRLPSIRSAVPILLLATLPAQAIVPCYHHDLATAGRLNQQIAEFTDSPKQRETVAEYARSHGLSEDEMEAKVAPTGRLSCGGGESSANLVVRGDTLLGAGHPFIDRKTCTPRSKPSDCTFTVEGRAPVRVMGIVASGNNCPARKGDVNSDWAILKLEKVIEGVTPYKVKVRGSRDGVVAQKVVAVGASSADFKRIDPKTNKVTYVKHVQDCDVRNVFYAYDPVLLGSDCAGSYGKSGGALLDPDLKEPTIMGISVGSPLSKAEAAREAKTGNPTRKPYHEKNWHDTGVAIDGDLYAELMKVGSR